MIFKNIKVEFHEPWGQGFRWFNGWTYYMVSGDDYSFYEIIPNAHHHKLLAIFPKSRIKFIEEKVL